jgi:hypothetical protein
VSTHNEPTAGKDINNRQVILLALLLQGGATGHVDLEDVAVQAYRLAPTRFRWNRYDYPSLEATRQAFKHWKDRKTEEPRVTQHRQTYLLTGIGVKEAVEAARSILQVDISSADEAIRAYKESAGIATDNTQGAIVARTRTTARPSQHELRRIRAHKLFKLWQSGNKNFEQWEIADLLNCLPNSSARVWSERFSRLNAMAEFWQDEELMRFLATIEERVAVKK